MRGNTESEIYKKLQVATDLVSGLALAIILQTSLRLPLFGVGFGEIILLICTLSGLLMTVWLWREGRQIEWRPFRSWGLSCVMAYMAAGLLPSTLYHASVGIPGVSLRDWVAYAFCAAFLCSIGFRPTNYRLLGWALVGGMIAFWLGSLFFGSSDIWYYERFRGWAANPNQIALYALCGLVLLVSGERPLPLAIAAAACIAVFGYLSKSDALIVGLAVFISATVFALLVPVDRFRQRTPWVLLVLVIFCLLFRSHLHDLVMSLWTVADNESARIFLYVHGIEAWLSSWSSFVFGLGAGSYSGVGSPFQGVEAHNSIIDALTIGGLPMLVAVYIFPVASLVLAYRKGLHLLFGVLSALLAFTLFHYVARQPIYWVASYGALVYLTLPRFLGSRRVS